jgi:hypothetical protein
MKKSLLILKAFVVLTIANCYSQLPDTDIFLFKARKSGKEHSFGEAKNITNRTGYDNQPCFSPDSKELLFVAVEDTTQSEIWKYNIEDKTKTRITNTEESEYSPTFIQSGTKISTVRVDKDGGQRFYLLDYPETTKAEYVKNSDSIGYSCWVNDSLITMFVVEDTSSLQVLNLKTQERTFVITNPGRCMKIHPKNKDLYFIDKNDSAHWFLSTYNFKTKKVKQVIEMLPGSEDFAFFSDGQLISGFKGGIFELKGMSWTAIGKPIASMENDFYRIAISPDDQYIAVVSFKGKKP